MAPEDAVRLFVERARAVTSADLPAEEVAALCERLERLPLAIELAAARVSVLSVGEIATRLDDSFHSCAPRPDRTVIARCVPFSIGATIYSTIANVPSSGAWPPFPENSVSAWPSRSRAVVRSTVGRARRVDRAHRPLAGASGTTRTARLATACSRPSVPTPPSGSARRARTLATSRRLVEAIRGLVETAEIRGPNGGLWSARLFAEIDSIRAALSFAATDEQSRVAAAFVVERTARLWSSWGLGPEAKIFTAALLATGPPPGAEASLRYTAGFLEGMSGNIDAARHEIETGITRAREAGDRRVLSALLSLLGILSWNFEHTDTAFIPLEEALEICRELGDELGVTDTTYAAGMVAWQGRGDLATGGRMIEEAVRRYRELGDRCQRGRVRDLRGQSGAATRRVRRIAGVMALDRREFRSLGDRSMTAMALLGGGLVASWSGRLEVARGLLSQASSLNAEIGEAPARHRRGNGTGAHRRCGRPRSRGGLFEVFRRSSRLTPDALSRSSTAMGCCFRLRTCCRAAATTRLPPNSSALWPMWRLGHRCCPTSCRRPSYPRGTKPAPNSATTPMPRPRPKASDWSGPTCSR